MKPNDWERIPGGPPLPELSRDPKAIEFWLAEVIQCGDKLETVLKDPERHFQWRIREDELQALLRVDVEINQIRFIE